MTRGEGAVKNREFYGDILFERPLNVNGQVRALVFKIKTFAPKHEPSRTREEQKMTFHNFDIAVVFSNLSHLKINWSLLDFL